jgi:Domain of unknown function (DUF4169)
MADIVNLRRARKAKDKRDKDALAEANRIKFGRTKAEKDLAKANAALSARALTGHKIEESGDDR